MLTGHLMTGGTVLCNLRGLPSLSLASVLRGMYNHNLFLQMRKPRLGEVKRRAEWHTSSRGGIQQSKLDGPGSKAPRCLIRQTWLAVNPRRPTFNRRARRALYKARDAVTVPREPRREEATDPLKSGKALPKTGLLRRRGPRASKSPPTPRKEWPDAIRALGFPIGTIGRGGPTLDLSRHGRPPSAPLSETPAG